MRTLDLVSTDMGADAIRELADALAHENCVLERLYLGGNGLRASDIEPLMRAIASGAPLTELFLSAKPAGRRRRCGCG